VACRRQYSTSSGQLKGTKMKKLQISEQLLNALIGYLGTRPYQEVFQLVDAMQAEAKNQPKVEDGQPNAD
jgi:hypothetical protein